MLVPTVVVLVLGVVLIAAGLATSAAGIAAVCLGTLVVVGVASDLRRVRSRRRTGAWIAHAGIGMAVIAIAGAAWTTSTTRELRPGDVLEVGGYQLEYREVERERDASRMLTRAVFEVRRGDAELGTLRAGRDFHPASGEVSNEVGIRHDLLRLHDLFVTVDRLTEDGEARVQAFVNPLVPLLWLSGLVLALGALLAGWPERSRTLQAPPADRNGDERVPSELDAVHELRNRAAAPRELLSSVRGAPRRPGP
jgi:cytochrome c-type biogenesis protein CcmF